MTEPVAYMLSDFVGNDFTSLELPKNPNNPRGLYFKEQLHQRVKMTQAEFDEFCLLYKKLSNATAMGILNTVRYNESKEFGNLKSLISKEGGDFKVLVLFDDFNPDNPEETIEIVPDMKWFVRSKKQYQPDIDQGISESGYLYLTQGDIYSIEYYEMTPFKDDAKYFDTKEQAEEWCDPSTEAVQLPVEDE